MIPTNQGSHIVWDDVMNPVQVCILADVLMMSESMVFETSCLASRVFSLLLELKMPGFLKPVELIHLTGG